MRAIFLFSLCLFSLRTLAFDVPTLTGPVVDQANVISPSDQAYLDRLIRRVYETSGVQLQVLTVASLNGEPIEQASIQVTDKWRIGKKGEDKGVLLMLSTGDHRVRIEVGRGLEGDLPDIDAVRIIRNVIIPNFQDNDYSHGIVAGVQTIASIVAPETGAAPQTHKRKLKGDDFVAVLFILFILFSIIVNSFGRRRGFGGGGFWGGGFGGGGFGGGGGGGWSGGGGGFAGGGASGDW